MEGRERKSLSGQLVLVGDAEDIAKRGLYRLGRIHCLHPQIRKGKEIVRRATVAVLANHSGSEAGKIQYAVKPRLSNASVLDQIGFRPKNYVSDFEHKFGSRPKRKKPSEHERAMVLHMSAFFIQFLV